MKPIIVADDDAVIRQVVTRLLGERGHVIVPADDGERAWDLITTIDPALIVLDWEMPVVDGLEVLRRIRVRIDRAAPYVVMLTSHESKKDCVRGLTLGADDYIVKPFNASELLARVHVGLRVVRLQDALTTRVDELEAALAHIHKLEALLPICSHCKRIRDEEDRWQGVDKYLGAHAGVQFTHGVCPDCAVRHYPEIQRTEA